MSYLDNYKRQDEESTPSAYHYDYRVMKIFYSWQSDLPNASNRGFIEKALENGAKVIRLDRSVDIEPVVDRDTAGISGAPEIVSTIFSKIDQADVFLFDVSIITVAGSARPSPNPNVLLELGYALKVLGEERVIMVLNVAYGEFEKLPFDLRTRRVIAYDMPEFQEERAAERKRLERSLEGAVRAVRPRLSLSSDYLEEFGSEPDRVKNLAFEQPAHWEYRLTTELLKPRLKKLKQEYDEVRNGLRYRKAIMSTHKTYFTFIQEKMIDLERMIAIFESLMNREIRDSWGPPGKPGNPFEIKRATHRVCLLCEAIVEWEADVRSAHPPEIFEDLKDLLQGTTSEMFTAIHRWVKEMSDILEQPEPKGEYEFNLVVNLPEGWAERSKEELKRISSWIREHPCEWNNQ